MSTGPLTWSIGRRAWACTRPSCGPRPGLDMCAVGAAIQLSLVKNGQSESCSCFTEGWRPFASRSASINPKYYRDLTGILGFGDSAGLSRGYFVMPRRILAQVSGTGGGWDRLMGGLTQSRLPKGGTGALGYLFNACWATSGASGSPKHPPFPTHRFTASILTIAPQ